MGEPRLPHNLQGLLRFCMQAGDDPQPSADAAPLDPERASWLSEAINSLTVNMGKKLKDNIAKLLQNADAAAAGDSTAADVCLDCLEETADLCDSLDVANDFVKLGGLEVAAFVCQRCAGVAELPASALGLMARLFQNNPFAQAAGVGCVAELVGVIRGGSGSTDGAVRFAALSALSCLVRDFPPAQAAFNEAGGPAAVASCLRAGDSNDGGRRLRRKAAFLLASLASESDAAAERLAGCGSGDANGVCDALAASILEAAAAASVEEDEELLDCLEHTVGCLLLLCQRRSPNAVVGVVGDDRRERLAEGLAALAGRVPAEQRPECAERLVRLLDLLTTGAPETEGGGGGLETEPLDR